MKQFIKQAAFVFLATALLAPASLLAQQGKDDKDKKEKKEAEQLIITRNKDSKDKLVIEIVGDKITVNGKPIDELKDGDVTVLHNKIKDAWAYGGGDNHFLTGTWNDNFGRMSMDENRAMLGVTTEKADKGVEIQTVSKESGAEKAGLKVKDVISKVDETKIEDPDDLSKAVRTHKPGDKVTITYLRDGKEQKATAELGKWKGMTEMQGFYSMPDMNFNMDIPKVKAMPRTRIVQGYGRSYNNSSSKLGVSVQDTEDGKGVKVLDVDEEGNGAKAGLKENDIITEVDGKSVNSADEIAGIMKDSKDKISIKMKLLRDGKSQSVDVKIPRKLKTTDL